MLAVDSCIQSLRAVFYHLQVVCFGNLHDLWHICRHPKKVNGNNRFCLRCDLSLDILRVDGPGLGIYVAPYDLSPCFSKWYCARTEGIRGNDHFIPFLNTAEGSCQRKSICRIVYRKCVICACKFSEILLKLGQLRPLCLALAVTHNIHYGSDLLFRIRMLPCRNGNPEAFHLSSA